MGRGAAGLKPGYRTTKRCSFVQGRRLRHTEGMENDPRFQTAARAEQAPTDEGIGLDRIVTAIAFAATVVLILLSPLGN